MQWRHGSVTYHHDYVGKQCCRSPPRLDPALIGPSKVEQLGVSTSGGANDGSAGWRSVARLQFYGSCVKFPALGNEMHRHLSLRSVAPQQGTGTSQSVEAGVLGASAKLASLPGLKGNLKDSGMFSWSIQPLPGCESQEPTHLRCSSSSRELQHLAGLSPGFLKAEP